MTTSVQTCLVTGAGSGVGRAAAIQLAKAGWRVAVAGRREAPLRETVELAGAAGGQITVLPCDIADREAVDRMAADALSAFGGRIDALVNAAGTNIPRRSLEQLSWEDYRQVVDASLDGLYLCAQAFLPVMRRQGRGTIINVNSVAGLRGNSFSGAAYVAAKFGAAGLIETINAEENQHGIRACSIFPGDINTPLLDKRPSPPPQAARQQMLQPEDVAACIVLALSLPERALAERIVIRPTV